MLVRETAQDFVAQVEHPDTAGLTGEAAGQWPAMPQLCVGRENELASINRQLELTRGQQGCLCLVRGGAGSGKSTLLREFTSRLQQSGCDLVVAWGHCDAQTGNLRPLLPWARILESLTGMSDITAPGEAVTDRRGILVSARSTFVEVAPDILELLVPGAGLVIRSAKLISDKTPLLGRLFGRRDTLDSAPLTADKIRLEDQYIALIDRVLDDSAVLLVIDDLHYADTASLDLLQRLAGHARARPLMLLVSAQVDPQNEVLGRALGVLADQLESAVVDLDIAMRERGPDLAAAYVNAVVPGLGSDFIGCLARHTGGHPLFVSELVNMLALSGQIRLEGCHWRAGNDIDWQALPNRVEKVLSAQFSALSEEVREVLQVASVEGDQFTVEVLAGVLDSTPLAIARLLSRNAPANLIEPLGSFTVAGQRATRFRFCHRLAQRHSYASIAEVERPYLHEAVARQYEGLVDTVPDSMAVQLAYQFDHARLNSEAHHYYIRAAQHAVSTCSLIEATSHLERAVILAVTHGEQASALAGLAKVRTITGRVGEALALFGQAIVLAEDALADCLPAILIDQAIALCREHRFEEALQGASRALELATAMADLDRQAAALDCLGHICSKRGDKSKALAYENDALAIACQLEDRDARAGILLRQGWCLKELGRYPEALESLTESLRIQAEGVANWSVFAATHNALADLNISTENYPAARDHLRQAITAWRKFDQHSDVAVALSNLANLANRENLFEEALAYGREAYALDHQTLGEDHAELAFSLSCIGESLLGLAEYGEAIEVLTRAQQLRSTSEVPEGNRSWTRWLLGRALVESRQQPERGMRLVRESRAQFLAMGDAAMSELKDADLWLARYGG